MENKKQMFLIFTIISLFQICLSVQAMQITPKQWIKYNTETIISCHFNDRHALLELKKNYHDLKIPDIIQDILSKKHQQLGIDELPDGSKFVFMINPFQMGLEEWENIPVEQLKNNSSGLSLIGWYLHKNLAKITTPIISKTFKEVEGDENNYLVSILDLSKKDIDYLKNIKSIIVNKLTTFYKVDLARDIVRLYFHFPYPKNTASLHIHVRINQGEMPELEKSKTFFLDDVISCLEEGKSIEDLILAKQEKYNNLYLNHGYEETLSQFKIPYETIPNHYFKKS